MGSTGSGWTPRSRWDSGGAPWRSGAVTSVSHASQIPEHRLALHHARPVGGTAQWKYTESGPLRNDRGPVDGRSMRVKDDKTAKT